MSASVHETAAPSVAPSVEPDAPEVDEPPEIELPAIVDDHKHPRRPEDLLAEANAKRTAHAWKAADALYARVKADRGTIRADFAASIDANAVHGSDAAETAAVEIAFFFAGMNLHSR